MILLVCLANIFLFVDCAWRKALRCVGSVNNRTPCDITYLSNQFPLILSLEKRFIKFIRNCLVCQNNIVKLFAVCNPMSNRCSHYRGTLDSDGKLSNMNDWHLISDNVCTKIDVLLDLINVREGNISCDGFTGEEINFMRCDICVN